MAALLLADGRRQTRGTPERHASNNPFWIPPQGLLPPVRSDWLVKPPHSQARDPSRLLRPQEGDADRSKAPPAARRRHELRVRVEPSQGEVGMQTNRLQSLRS